MVGPLVAAAVGVRRARADELPAHWFILLIFWAAGAWSRVRVIAHTSWKERGTAHWRPSQGCWPEAGWGVLGIYLSIPVMASLRIVWRRWRLCRKSASDR